ncbi:unnamed protein product, partial [Gordionus sp. m RMFG-2023]
QINRQLPDIPSVKLLESDVLHNADINTLEPITSIIESSFKNSKKNCGQLYASLSECYIPKYKRATNSSNFYQNVEQDKYYKTINNTYQQPSTHHYTRPDKLSDVNKGKNFFQTLFRKGKKKTKPKIISEYQFLPQSIHLHHSSHPISDDYDTVQNDNNDRLTHKSQVTSDQSKFPVALITSTVSDSQYDAYDLVKEDRVESGDYGKVQYKSEAFLPTTSYHIKADTNRNINTPYPSILRDSSRKHITNNPDYRKSCMDYYGLPSQSHISHKGIKSHRRQKSAFSALDRKQSTPPPLPVRSFKNSENANFLAPPHLNSLTTTPTIAISYASSRDDVIMANTTRSDVIFPLDNNHLVNLNNSNSYNKTYEPIPLYSLRNGDEPQTTFHKKLLDRIKEESYADIIVRLPISRLIGMLTENHSLFNQRPSNEYNFHYYDYLISNAASHTPPGHMYDRIDYYYISNIVSRSAPQNGSLYAQHHTRNHLASSIHPIYQPAPCISHVSNNLPISNENNIIYSVITSTSPSSYSFNPCGVVYSIPKTKISYSQNEPTSTYAANDQGSTFYDVPYCGSVDSSYLPSNIRIYARPASIHLDHPINQYTLDKEVGNNHNYYYYPYSRNILLENSIYTLDKNSINNCPFNINDLDEVNDKKLDTDPKARQSSPNHDSNIITTQKPRISPKPVKDHVYQEINTRSIPEEPST